MFQTLRLSTGTIEGKEDRDSSLQFEISRNKSDDSIPNIQWNLSSVHKKKSTVSSSSLHLISSGRLFVVTGRSKYYHNGVLMKEIPFEISLQNADSITTTEITEDEDCSLNKKSEHNETRLNRNDQELKNVLRDYKSFLLKASGFSDNCPISALSLIFTVGDYKTENIGYRSVLLLKGTIEMMEKQSYVPGHTVESTGDTCEHVADRIILLTAQLGIPKIARETNEVYVNSNEMDRAMKEDNIKPKNKKQEVFQLDNILQILQNISILMVLAAILIHPDAFEKGIKRGLKWALKVPSQIPSGLPGDAPQLNLYRNITVPYADTVIFSYILKTIQLVLSLFIFLLYILTPFRIDFLEVCPVYFRKYVLENLLGFSTYSDQSSLTFFVHGWNAWGFCGSIPQGTNNLLRINDAIICM